MRMTITADGPILDAPDELKKIEDRMRIEKAKRISETKYRFADAREDLMEKWRKANEQKNNLSDVLAVLENEILQNLSAMNAHIEFIEKDYCDAVNQLRSTGIVREDWT